MNRITHFKKRLLNTLMLLVFGFSFSQVLDQFNTPVPLSGGAFQLSSAPIHNAGQSFVCGITGDLSQVNIRVGDFTGAFVAGSFQLRIFSGNGYGGTVLNTTFFNVNTIPELNTYAEFAIPLSSLVPVTAGNSYTIDLRGITGTVQTNGTNQLYNNGGLYVNNGATFFYNTNDLWFKTFVVPAPAGASLSFDGSNDFVKVNDNPLLDFGSNDFTVEYWVYKKNANVYGGVSKWNTKLSPTTNEWGLLLNADGAGSNRPNFIIESGSTSYDCPASTNLNLNTWYHLAGVREGTNLKIYVNGILENTVPIGNITVNNSGRDLLIDRLLSGYFGGAIYDEIRIWNRALSACEIQYNKDAELANGQSGLVAYFKCNQGIANSDNSGLIDLIDETPNGFEGEITNFQLNGTTSNFVLPGSPASAVSGTLYNLLSVNITQEFCNAAQVSDLIATGSGTINWYDVATGGIPLSNTQNLVTGNYYVSQTTGTCESERTSVNVIINSTPIPVANANQTYDANATVASLVATGNNLKWYSLAEGGTELSSSTLLTSATY